MWIFPLKSKSDVFSTFQQFLLTVERQFQTKLKSVQTDWGGEFRNLSKFFSSLGITHRLSCPHTSEQNGVVERRHRHVVETGLTLLAQSGVPQRFWHYAFDTAVYLINRMPSRTNSNISPFEHVFKHKPDFSFLRVFGCRCYPHLRPYNKHKMDFRSLPCIFLGYSTSHHGYRCFDPLSERLYIARHVRFHEQLFPYQISPSSPPTSSFDPYTSSYPNPVPDISTPSNTSPTPPTSPTPSPSNTSPPPPISPTPSPFNTSPTPPTSPTPSPASSSSPISPHEPPLPPLLYTFARRPKTTTTSQPENTTSQLAHSTSQPDSSSSLPRPRPSNLRPNPKPSQPYSPASYHTTTVPTEPATFNVANKSPQWRQAMADEYSALQRNNTWK
ncbi:unnamed protein product [Lactuca virosa]|uniref:Integrase catalytic domain-containing protein n=1 Tax=Lactuca virosa TaxID=75947 RepID=A0AAU9NKT2_9ASTR|nr:unnamed protein product [Lactuca virosa]